MGRPYTMVQFKLKLQRLIDKALNEGIVLDIIHTPRAPLAMGNYTSTADARLAREVYPSTDSLDLGARFVEVSAPARCSLEWGRYKYRCALPAGHQGPCEVEYPS